MSASSIQQLRILLAEPSEVQRKVISRQLNEAGVSDVAGVGTVAEALQAIERSKPDLVASAMYFADGTAHDLINSLQQHQLHTSTQFMLVSSEWRQDQLEQLKQSGIVAILPKPFTSEQLQRAVSATVDLMEPETLTLEHLDIEDLRVLIVDDSVTSRHYLMRVLQNMGVDHVVEAEDGMQAVEILDQQRFDLIVTDFNMPEMNGRDLADKVRENPHHAHTPILMVTARANAPQLANIKQSGIDALTDKPFEPAVLRQLLTRILEP
ncbi:two-component system response regulator [Idiomarina tyrosinivorans]|uniref:Two-component system response regulator n=1 Tax=Idiomarina tyrosinivorans TaxID=1445662 RepID=A0A432ZLK8_9GAMM|nr:response regulator [Idiomarina tyrosinivorans]RUO78877.1 two-component system response regulator [Idiomarina tyrosinivorans]